MAVQLTRCEWVPSGTSVGRGDYYRVIGMICVECEYKWSWTRGLGGRGNLPCQHHLFFYFILFFCRKTVILRPHLYGIGRGYATLTSLRSCIYGVTMKRVPYHMKGAYYGFPFVYSMSPMQRLGLLLLYKL